MHRYTYAAFAAAGLALAGCTSDGSSGSGETPESGSAATAPAAGAPTGTFKATNEFVVAIPEGAKSVRIWLARPQKDAVTIDLKEQIDAPAPHSTASDNNGNTYTYFDLQDPKAGDFKVVHAFTITRAEQSGSTDPAKTRAHTEAELAELAPYLGEYTYVKINDTFQTLAGQIVGDETNPTVASRKIYDWVLENIDYWVKDPEHKKSSGRGDADYCYTSKTGNCTDFHSLYLSLSRAAKIPARITYGSMFKTPLDGQDQDQSYHCWIEYHAPNVGWVPLDVALADVFHDDFGLNDVNTPKVMLTTADGYEKPDPAKVNYYFGHLEPRRVTWSTGRDLRLEHQQDAEPVNAMPKAYVEIDGKAASKAYSRKLTFTEVK